MDEEQEYIDYVAAFSLSMLAASSAYLINVSEPITYLTVLSVPILFGYTAYSSRNSFRKSSLFSLVSLMFVMINPITAVVSMVIAFGNPLVSAFSGGEHFHDYFHSISVPLIITGLIVGSIGFYAVNTQPDLKDQIRNQSASFVGDRAESFTERTELVSSLQSSQVDLIERTSQVSVMATEAHVLNETKDDLSAQDRQKVLTAFESAKEEIPSKIKSSTEEKMGSTTPDISNRVSSTVKKSFTGKMFFAIIPLTAAIVYSLHPVIGFLTAISATLFGRIDRRYGVFGAY